LFLIFAAFQAEDKIERKKCKFLFFINEKVKESALKKILILSKAKKRI
jgi:hypothetical protein